MKTWEHFILKSQVLSLYRNFQKLIIKTNNYNELKWSIRSEFDNNRNINDLKQIKYLYQDSLKKYKDLENYLSISS